MEGAATSGDQGGTAGVGAGAKRHPLPFPVSLGDQLDKLAVFLVLRFLYPTPRAVAALNPTYSLHFCCETVEGGDLGAEEIDGFAVFVLAVHLSAPGGSSDGKLSSMRLKYPGSSRSLYCCTPGV